jgi:hypothetical protein
MFVLQASFEDASAAEVVVPQGILGAIARDIRN